MGKMISVFTKIFILLFLIFILTLLCIHYYDNYQMHPSFPTDGLNQSQIQDVFKTSGEVVKLQDYGFDILDEYNNIIPVLSPTKPKIGDQVEILGILEPSGYFKSIEVVVIEKWGYESLFLRSFIGLIFMTIIFLWYWKLDFKKFLFVRRK